jgi:hypothetical protein
MLYGSEHFKIRTSLVVHSTGQEKRIEVNSGNGNGKINFQPRTGERIPPLTTSADRDKDGAEGAQTQGELLFLGIRSVRSE